MSTALTIPQGATVLTLETPTLLQVIQIANSVITPYLEASENYDNFDNLQKWSIDLLKPRKLSEPYPWPETYGLERHFLSEINKIHKIVKTSYFSANKYDLSVIGNNAHPLDLIAKKIMKNNLIQSDIHNAKTELEIAENNLNANIQYVNLIPPDYRFPLALDEMYSYLLNGRAESWKEAVNLFEETLHRWKLEQDSEEALLLQAQTAALAGRAASGAGAAALFSGIRLFMR